MFVSIGSRSSWALSLIFFLLPWSSQLSHPLIFFSLICTFFFLCWSTTVGLEKGKRVEHKVLERIQFRFNLVLNIMLMCKLSWFKNHTLRNCTVKHTVMSPAKQPNHVVNIRCLINTFFNSLIDFLSDSSKTLFIKTH
jgi:hypothetical protein